MIFEAFKIDIVWIAVIFKHPQAREEIVDLNDYSDITHCTKVQRVIGFSNAGTRAGNMMMPLAVSMSP